MSDKKEVEKIALPEGCLTNQSLFVKDIYKDPVTGKEGPPSYKCEVAIPMSDCDAVEEKLAAFAVEKWGAGADTGYFDGKIRSPFLDGDKKAAEREEKGKEGNAYKGCYVVRAHTNFNLQGQDGPGGIQVFDPEVQPIDPVASGAIYPGCYGIALVSIGAYISSETNTKSLMFYLSAFQKTRDGDPLISSADHSQAFKPVGRDQDGGTGGRRRREG